MILPLGKSVGGELCEAGHRSVLKLDGGVQGCLFCPDASFLPLHVGRFTQKVMKLQSRALHFHRPQSPVLNFVFPFLGKIPQTVQASGPTKLGSSPAYK